MAYTPGDEHLAIRQLGVLPYLPLMLMARVLIVGKSLRFKIHRQVYKLIEVDVACMRPPASTVADMNAYSVFRDATQRMVYDLHQFGETHSEILQGHGDSVILHHRCIDLEDKAGVYHSLVFSPHCLRASICIFLLRSVILVALVDHVVRSYRWHERFSHRNSLQGSFEVTDLPIHCLMAVVTHRAHADHFKVRVLQ